MSNTEAPPILSRCGPCIYFASKFPLSKEYVLAPFYVALGTNISSQTPHPMKDLRLSNYQKLHVPQIDNELIEVEGKWNMCHLKENPSAVVISFSSTNGSLHYVRRINGKK